MFTSNSLSMIKFRANPQWFLSWYKVCIQRIMVCFVEETEFSNIIALFMYMYLAYNIMYYDFGIVCPNLNVRPTN